MIRLFNVSIPTTVLLMVLSDTVLISGCYVLAAVFALNSNFTDPWTYFRYEGGWIQLIFAVAIIQIGLYLFDLYDDVRLRSRALLLRQLQLLLGFAFLVQALAGYLEFAPLQLPQWTMIIGSFLVLVVIPSWRWVFFSTIRATIPNQRLLFLGMTPTAEEIIQSVTARPDLGYEVLGYIGEERQGPGFLGTPEVLEEKIRSSENLTVVLDQRQVPTWLSTKMLLELRQRHIAVEDTAQVFEMIFGRVSLRDRSSFPEVPRDWTLRVQTLYSFTLATLGLIVALPIMLLVYIAVKLTSRGPALYKQKRLGRNRVPFYLYKFRSMYIDAEARTGPVWATKNDPRVTPIGRWLRKLRLDELPQFFNVIRGDMALVGPRPERPEFCEVLEQKIPLYDQRLLVKPGITGWAQINYSYTETIEDTVTKLEYDLYYVKHLAPSLDMYIIFHTLKVMLLFRGAQ